MARRPNATLAPTPLRRWRERTDRTYEALAKEAGLARSTVMLAAAGKPVDAATAAAIEAVTGIPAAELVAGVATSPAPAAAPKKRPSTKKGKGQAKNVREKARILVEADGAPDAVVAERHGIGVRTLERWRAELETDPALARAWRALQERIESAFVGDAARAFKALAERAAELARTETDIRAVVVGLEKLGDVLVQARALPPVDDEDEDDGRSTLDREGAASPEDPEAAGTGAIH